MNRPLNLFRPPAVCVCLPHSSRQTHLNWDKCWAQTICTSDRSAGENKAWKNEPAENNGWVYKHHVLYTSSQRFVCVCVSLTVNPFAVVCVCVLSVYFIIVKSQHLSHTHTVCLSIVLSWSIIPVSGICSHPALTLFFLFHYRFVLSVRCVFVSNLQAVNHSPPVSSVVLLLPLRQPPDQLEDGALGERRVPVGRPANELEVLHQAVTVLWLKRDEGKIRILITTAVVITIKIKQYFFFYLGMTVFLCPKMIVDIYDPEVCLCPLLPKPCRLERIHRIV